MPHNLCRAVVFLFLHIFFHNISVMTLVQFSVDKQDFNRFFPLSLSRKRTYTRNSFSTQRSYELNESCALFGNAQFDAMKKTVLYIHGYLEGLMHESVNVIVDAYLQRNDHNVLALEWSELAAGNYLIDAVPNAKQVFYFIILL